MKIFLHISIIKVISIIAFPLIVAGENFVVVKDELASTMYDYSFRPETTTENSIGPFYKVSNDNPLLANKLLSIKGVDWVMIDRHNVTVLYSKAYTEKEITREVTWILKKHFGGRNMIVLKNIRSTDRQFESKLLSVLLKSY